MTGLRQAVAAAARNLSFERAAHHGWRRVAFVLLFMNVALTVALVSAIELHEPDYITIAATPDGRVYEAQTLREPVRTAAALQNWTVTAVTEAYTFGHHDFRMRLNAAREYFTNEGYDGFMSELERTLYLDRIRNNYQVASAVAQGAAIIRDSGVFADPRPLGSVKLEFPLLFTFHAGKKVASTSVVAQVLVMRVPFDERASGLGIEQLLIVREGQTG